MKKLLQHLIVLALLIAAGTLSAQSIVVRAGTVARVSDYYLNSISYRVADDFVFGPQINVEYQLSHKWTINLGIDYTRAVQYTREYSHETDQSFYLTNAQNMWSILPEARFYFSESLKGFFLGGRAGIYPYVQDQQSLNRYWSGRELFVSKRYDQYEGVAGMAGITLGGQIIIDGQIPIEIKAGIGQDFGNENLFMDLSLTVGYLFQRKPKDIWR